MSSETKGHDADRLPTTSELERAFSVEAVDKDGVQKTFGELLRLNEKGKEDKGTRTLVIFIRHFWCTNCQVYTHQLSAAIPPESLPENTQGCGTSAPIASYVELTASRHPVYSCPSLELHEVFQFVRTLRSSNPNSACSKPDPHPNPRPGHASDSTIKADEASAQGEEASKTNTSSQEKQTYLSSAGGVASRTWHAIKNGLFTHPSHALDSVRGPKDQNGGELVIERDGTCSFIHRMQHTEDHSDLEELAGLIGATYVPLSEETRRWPRTMA